MIGLVLGPYGVNHNIEIHDDVIEYSKARLKEFIKSSIQFDHFDFCMPKFVHGNFLNIIINEDTFLYDRIYVGTGVSQNHLEFIKSFLKINGILVMPLDDLVSLNTALLKIFLFSIMNNSLYNLNENLKLNF
jgi:hypothetical protein